MAIVERPSGRIAIYVRVSSRGQEENESIPTQIAACTEYANDIGYSDDQIDTFEEVHTGEELWERDEMSRLRKLIERRTYEGLIVYCVDRLSRKVAHQMIIEEECRHADCTIHYVQGGPPNTREGRLVRQVEGIVAEMEHERIVERTNRGRREKVRSGRIVGNGEPPYGYIYSRDDRGKPVGLIPDAITSQYVVGMYERLSRGQSLCAIARWLNDEHAPVPGAGRKRRLGISTWYSASVRFIIKNATYKGVVYLGKQRAEVVVDPITGRKRKKLVRQPEDSWQKMENPPVIPLVSESLWEDANNRLRINKLHSARNNRHQDQFLLRGMVFCGECGGIMYAKYDTKVGYFYACGSQWRENGRDRCIAPASIQACQLDPAVWSVVEGYLKDPDRFINHMESLRQEKNTSLQPEIEKVDAKISELSTRIRNAFTELVGITDPDIKDALRMQMTLWQKHLAQFRADKETLLGNQQQWLHQQDKAERLKKRLVSASELISRADIETKREALSALGACVKVFKAPRKGPQDPNEPPRWSMTWDMPISPDDIVNESLTIPIHNRVLIYWSWSGSSISPVAVQ
jgi:site-specific DNA recombinase